MARKPKPDRMFGKKFHSPHSYRKLIEEKKIKKVKPEEEEETYYLEKGSLIPLTVPGQAISIKELMKRHEKGRPIPVE